MYKTHSTKYYYHRRGFVLNIIYALNQSLKNTWIQAGLLGKQLHILVHLGHFLCVSVNDFVRVRMFGLNPKLAHWASELLKLLAQQENLLVPDYWNGWDFFKALSWEIVQMPAYECPEAVAICLLLNNLLNTHYFSVLFRWARACMKRGRSARHATGKGAGKMCCVWHS